MLGGMIESLPRSRVAGIIGWLEVVPQVPVVGALSLAFARKIFYNLPYRLGILQDIQ